MLPEVNDVHLVQKCKYLSLNLKDINPKYGVEYDKAKHGNELHPQLNSDHLTMTQQLVTPIVIKKY
jgi:hypothetical protein